MVVMLVIIGAKINAGVAYWIFFGIWCALRFIKVFKED